MGANALVEGDCAIEVLGLERFVALSFQLFSMLNPLLRGHLPLFEWLVVEVD